MKMFVLKTIETTDFQEFVNFWSGAYFYSDSEEKYPLNIDKPRFESTELLALSQIYPCSSTKNQIKQHRLKRYWQKLNGLIHSKRSSNSMNFLRNLKTCRLFGKYFYYIEYSQKRFRFMKNVHRAFVFLQNGDFNRVKNTISKIKKEEFYFKTYLPFFQNSGISDSKKFDEAMFAVGKFLNQEQNFHLAQPHVKSTF